MTGDYFESALGSLMKEQGKDRLMQILNEIRKGVEGTNRRDNVKKLHQKGCFGQVVKKLQEPHLDIVSLTLSILGYCCMDRICAREAVMKYSILVYLNHLLKHYKQDSIQGRVFRIIGNICHHWERLGNIILQKECCLHMISKLVTYINKYGETIGDEECKLQSSEATLTMALRALNKLLNCSSIGILVEDCQIVKALGGLLIKFTLAWEKSKEHKEFLEKVLTLIYEYCSRYQHHNVVVQLHSTRKGNATECLEKLVVLNPLLVMRVSVTLGEVQRFKNDVPFGEISRSFIQLLQDPTNFNRGRADPKHNECLRCLCFLMKQSFICRSREDILDCNLIGLFFTILKDKSESADMTLKNQILIISSLKSKYMFEETQRYALLKNGIIDVLSDLLDELVGSDLDINTNHSYKLKKSDTPSWSNAEYLDSAAIRLLHEKYYEPPYGKRSLSPSSDTSSGPSCSPPCSPAVSLSDTDVFHNESSDSDDYSPICSDAEEGSADLPSIIIGDNVADEFKNVTSKENSPIDEKTNDTPKTKQKRSLSSLKRQLSFEIIDLIKTFVILKKPVPMELGSSDLLIKLLKFFLPTNKLWCARETLNVIKMITQKPEYLLSLMQSDFIVATHKFLSVDHGSNCTVCINFHKLGQSILLQLTRIVEKECGQGDIAHQLYRGNLSVKEKLVLVIPFIASTKKVLSNFFITCGGLDILIQLFRKTVAMPQKNCISSLCVLASKLSVKNPASRFNEMSDKYVDLPIDVQYYEVEKTCTTIVRFKLDDGACIEADREFLSQKSDYFNRLLYGEFKESEENEIRLSNVHSKSLKVLLILLQYDLDISKIYKINLELDVLLDLIVLTDRYILQDLCVCLTMSVQYFKFLPTTIPAIYQWSLESQTDILRVECIAYALVGCTKDCERYSLFESLIQQGYSEQLADDVQQLLVSFMYC